jgi:outer membrane lipoprotein-sorting protein
LFVCAAIAAFTAVAGDTVPEATLTAARIVEKNLAARGGLEAWQNVRSMAWIGHVQRASAPEPTLPFLLELKRPNMTRFEITSLNQKSVRVYDGKMGWKMRPGSNGRQEVDAYSADELRYAREAQVIDGPLMDFANKGYAISLDNEEEVEGRKTYRLSIKMPSGVNQHVWVDAETFLELKYDRVSKSPVGVWSSVPVFLRNYQNFEGLQIPTTIETRSSIIQSDKVPSDKMVIEKIALNPPLDDEVFAKPRSLGRRGKALVDTRTPPPQSPPAAIPRNDR